MHKGERRVIPRKGTYDVVTIDRLPEVPSCSVTVRVPSKPAAITLQPQGAPIENWQYKDGRVPVPVPAFDVHQIVVVDMGPDITATGR